MNDWGESEYQGIDWKADAEGNVRHTTANAVARAKALEVQLGQLRGELTLANRREREAVEHAERLSALVGALARQECRHEWPNVYVAITPGYEDIPELISLDVLDHAPVLVDPAEMVFVAQVNSGKFLRWHPPHEPGGNTDDCRIPNCPACAAAEERKL